MTDKRVDVKGGGPNWTALVRRSDRQVMVAFAGTNEAALHMVDLFLRTVGNRIPRSELILVELSADFRVTQATDIWHRFRIFEAKNEAARMSDDWIRKQ